MSASAALPGGDERGAATSQQAESKAYFLHIQGRAMPLKQALVNGVNVLGGSVISLSLPVNISGYTRAGLNTLQIDYISDPKSNLVIQVEKRTPGPKTEEIANISLAADDSKGAVKSSSISFNLPADGGIASVGELSDSDKAAISEEFVRYYQALASAKADQVRALYRQSLADERKLCPESAHFFENVIAREVAILKNKNLKLIPLNKDSLAFKTEGDVVKLYRTDNKALVESNEVDAEISPLMVEVSKETPEAKSKSAKKSIAKTRPIPANPDKDIEIASAAFKASEKVEDNKPIEVKNPDGTIVAREISVEETSKVFDGSVPKNNNAEGGSAPVKTAVRERLVRFNLYFKPTKPSSSGKRSWIISLPPNV